MGSNVQRWSRGKMLSNSITCYRKIVCERKSPSMWQTSLLSYLKKLPHSPQPSETIIVISQQSPTLRQDQQKDYDAEGSDDA